MAFDYLILLKELKITKSGIYHIFILSQSSIHSNKGPNHVTLICCCNACLFVASNSKDEKRWYADCYRKATLYDAASPYLFPFVIEFSLLSAALFYKLYSNIGMTTVCNESQPDDDKDIKEYLPHHNGEIPQCHKANTGLFLGLALLVGK